MILTSNIQNVEGKLRRQKVLNGYPFSHNIGATESRATVAFFCFVFVLILTGFATVDKKVAEKVQSTVPARFDWTRPGLYHDGHETGHSYALGRSI